jgi:hypothetical protein
MAGAQPPPVTVRSIQWAIAAVFFILGGWALPGNVIMLALCVIGRRRAEA